MSESTVSEHHTAPRPAHDAKRTAPSRPAARGRHGAEKPALPHAPRTPHQDPAVREDSAVRAQTSWAQQSLWFIHQLEGASAAYNIPLALHLEGPLDRQALESAYERLILRHEALRTRFAAIDGVPWQIISPQASATVVYFDLSGETPARREALLDEHLHAESHEPFDLGIGPLIRARLLKLTESAHALLITVHHIVCDAWSIGLILQEVATEYGAALSGSEKQRPPLPLQYADYVHGQRGSESSAALETHLAYWCGRLTGAPAEIDLPKDRARPSIAGYRGAEVEIAIDRELDAKVRAMARRHGLTLFMVVLGAWAVFLSRLSRQEDVVIGTPVLNRRRTELEPIVGLFVNTLALRLEPSRSQAMSDYLKHVREVTVGALKHQDFPFERLVEALQPDRSLSRHPLFQVMFALQNAPAADMQWTHLTVRRLPQKSDTAKFDLTLFLEDQGGTLAGHFSYDSDLFDRATIERWRRSFLVLLRAFTDADQVPVGRVALLDEAERHELAEFNVTHAPYAQDRLIHELFESQVDRTPHLVAVEYEGTTLTYGELNAQANRLARALKRFGVQPHERVGVCLERSVDLIVAVLATLKAGGAYLPLDPNYPPERLTYMLEDGAPRVVLTEERLRALLGASTCPVVTMSDIAPECATHSAENLAVSDEERRSEPLVYVIYTSGSTGKPKGVAMPHHPVVNLIEWHREALGSVLGQRVLQFAALSFDVAFQEIFSTLCAGGTLVLIPEWMRRDPRALLGVLKDRQIARWFIPPLMLQSVAESAHAQGLYPSSLRDVITAGEALRITPDIVHFFEHLPHGPTRCRLHNHYGPTETHVVTALTLGDTPAEWSALPSIGRPIANTALYVLDENRELLPVGFPGELFIGGDALARGYLHRPELTAQRFIASPFDPSGQARLYRTGDLARWHLDGTLEYLGRNDDQVKLRGFRIELGEIEAQLSQVPGVRDAVVVAREDAPGAKRLIAYLTAREHVQLSAETLRAHLSVRVPDYMVPSAFVVLEHLPLTPSGKLNRRALPAPEESAFAAAPYEPPRTPIEQHLAPLWQDLLRVNRVGRDDNFFELGGHSLHAMKLIAAIEKRFGVHLPVSSVFKHPTIAQMALALESEVTHGSKGPMLEALAIHRAPLSHSQRMHWNVNQLATRASVRQVALALRVRGTLHIPHLHAAIRALIERHAALRTRIELHEGAPIQVVDAHVEWEGALEDFSALALADRERAVRERLEAVVTEPIDVRRDALFDIRLFKLSEHDHVLAVALEHLISDAFSLDILLRDLFALYVARLRSGTATLPPVGMPFVSYAHAQHAQLGERLARHQENFAARLAAGESLRCREDEATSERAALPWTSISVQIDRSLKERIAELARQRRTTPVMCMLTAYVALLARWRDARDVLVQYQINGRASPQVQQSIGFFACVLYLRATLEPNATFASLLDQMVDEYCTALPHADEYYFASQEPRPPFTRTSIFNWVPQGEPIDLSALQNTAHALACEPFAFVNRVVERWDWDNDPMTVLLESDVGVSGYIHFPQARFHRNAMERFARAFIALIEAIADNPQHAIGSVDIVR